MDRERRGESVKETGAIGDRVDRTARAIGDRHGDLASETGYRPGYCTAPQVAESPVKLVSVDVSMMSAEFNTVLSTHTTP